MSHSFSTVPAALFHKSMLRKDFIRHRIRLPRQTTMDTSKGGNDWWPAGERMPEMNIDLERVISDPAYRRTVLDYLKSEADGKAARRAAPAQAAAASPKQSAPAK